MNLLSYFLTKNNFFCFNFALLFINLLYLQVSPIISVCLAALAPLTLLEIYYSINSLNTTDFISWDEFLQRFKVRKGHKLRFKGKLYHFLFLLKICSYVINFFFRNNYCRHYPVCWSSGWTIPICFSTLPSGSGWSEGTRGKAISFSAISGKLLENLLLVHMEDPCPILIKALLGPNCHLEEK